MTTDRERVFVYVSNIESREVLVFELNMTNGELQLVEHVLGGKFGALAVVADKRFLYATLRDAPYAIATLAIDPNTGKLEHIGETPLPAALAYVSIDGSGRWLLGASYHQDMIVVCALSPDGVPQEPHQVVTQVPKAHCVLVDPRNEFVLATALGADALLRWPFDPERGTLNEQQKLTTRMAPGAGPRHMEFSASGDQLYVLNELDASLCVLHYDSISGPHEPHQKLSTLPARFRGKPWAADVHVTPNGRFLYACERSSSAIAAFTIDSVTGALAPYGTLVTEKQPRSFAIDPTGRYLLIAGEKSNRLSVYSIDASSGALTMLAPYGVGANPVWLEIVAI